MVKRVIGGTYRSVKILVFLIIIMLAAYVSLGRYYLPKLTDYRQLIIEQVAANTGLKIDLAGLSGSWYKFSPSLIVKGFKLYGANEASGKTALIVDELSVHLSALSSLSHGQLVFDRLSLHGVNITLQQRADGSWGLPGFRPGQKPKKGQADGFTTLRQLLDESRQLMIKDSKIELLANNGRRVELGSLTLKMNRSENQLKGNLSINVDDGSQAPLTAEIEGDGDLLSDDLKVTAAVHFNKAQLAYFQPLAPDYIPNSLLATGKVVLSYDSESGMIVNSDLNFTNIDINNMLAKKLPVIKALGGSFSASYQPDGEWQLYARKLTSDWEDHFAIDRLSVAYTSKDGFSGAASSVDIGALTRTILAAGVLAGKGKDALVTLSPSGHLNRIHWQYRPKQPLAERLLLKAELSDVSVSSWKGAPGAKELSGYLEAGMLSGFVDLDNSSLKLGFPQVFHEELVLNKAKGRVQWQVGERVEVNSGPLALSADFGRGTVQLDLDIAKSLTDPQPSTMSLLVGLSDSEASYRNCFIPYTLPEPLLDWLGESIKGGHINKAGFTYYGDFQPGTGKSVQLAVDVDKGVLDFDKKWPTLKNIRGRLDIDNFKTTMRIDSATFLGAKLRAGKVIVAQGKNSLMLSVQSQLAADSGSVLRLFKETPLSAMTGGVFDNWKATGKVTGAINLSLPLSAKKQVASVPYVDVVASLKDTAISIASLDLDMDKINGPLRYNTRRGLSSKGLNGRLWQQPMEAVLTTENVEEKGKQQQNFILRTEGLVTAKQLQQWSKQPVLGFFSGQTRFTSKLVIAPGKERAESTVLNVKSDLKGIGVDLPPPYDKSAEQLWPLTISVPFDKKNQLVEFYLRDRAQLQLQYLQGKVDRAELVLGGQRRPMIHDHGFLITGNMSSLELTPWLDTLSRYRTMAITMAEHKSGKAATQESDSGMSIFARKLKIDRLTMFDQMLEHVVTNVESTANGWNIVVNNKKLSAKVELAEKSNQLSIIIDKMIYPFSEPKVKQRAAAMAVTAAAKSSADSVDPLSDARPSEYPPMKVEIHSITINGDNYGRWKFHTRPYQKGVLFQNIEASLKGLKISGQTLGEGASLNWQRDGQQHSSQFKGVVTGDNIGEVLKAWGLPKAITSHSAEFKAELGWRGSPLSIALARFDGNISIRLDDGRFIQTAGSSAEALKLFGLMNFANIARRLKLDFSDLYKKGLSYDKVRGTVYFEQGLMRIDKPLTVHGPSSDFKLSGLFNLEEEKLDAELVVTLPITANLPWMVALAGAIPTGGASLPAAAGVYLVSKLFKTQLDSLSSAVYSIKGSWSDPSFKFERVFDVSNNKFSAEKMEKK